jgi:holo-[acyl-carrier protein] synthase
MILGLGNDIIENQRIRTMYQKFGDRFLERIFSQEEIHYCMSHRDPVPHLAVRFAVKEAAIKALNLRGVTGLLMRDAVIDGHYFGKKTLRLQGRLLDHAARLGVSHLHLSMSHSAIHSLATVILEGEESGSLPAKDKQYGSATGF